ncbi:hypothetical protein AY555_03420 [Haematospirillum jordaniae]|uniref:Uncharacterized protein n=1 Tax=Haematospirillum jordaniae TaxID=1549855 RepID=A0A143DCD2_9PROT|nr:hypothetical protein AY555_03420 [Haematospirillum jordaniae]
MTARDHGAEHREPPATDGPDDSTADTTIKISPDTDSKTEHFPHKLTAAMALPSIPPLWQETCVGILPLHDRKRVTCDAAICGNTGTWLLGFVVIERQKCPVPVL